MPHPQSKFEHLYVVISHCDDTYERVLLVNFTTFVPGIGQEECCKINAGEHPFVKHATVVNYSEALEPIVLDINTAAARLIIRQLEKVSPELLKKIQDGAKISKALPKKFRKYFEKF